MAVHRLDSQPDTEHELARLAEQIAENARRGAELQLRYQILLVKHAARLATAEAAPMQLLSVKHAAELVDVDESTIWRAVGDSSLPSRSVGRNRRIALDDLSRWTLSQT